MKNPCNTMLLTSLSSVEFAESFSNATQSVPEACAIGQS